MSSRKGLSREQVDSIVTLCKNHGWTEAMEPNPYLLIKLINENQNIKIYSSKHGYSIVCNSEPLLQQVLKGKFIETAQFPNEIAIDDVGIGLPIGGIGIGYQIITQESLSTPHFEFDIIDVKYFQTPQFEEKGYLRAVADKILQKLAHYKVDHTWLIKICTGYVFHLARIALLEKNYNITTTKITGPLQDYVECEFRKHLEKTYSIPAQIITTVPTAKSEYRTLFNRVINYIRANPNSLAFCKTGWSYFKQRFMEGGPSNTKSMQ
jgi:hypothetical protein